MQFVPSNKGGMEVTDSNFWVEIKEKMKYLLQFKIEEFADFDYQRITEEDILEYLQYKYRKLNGSEIHIYDLVNTILNLTPVHMMKYFSLMAIQGKKFI